MALTHEHSDETRAGIARLGKLIALHAPYDGSFELRTPGVCAIRVKALRLQEARRLMLTEQLDAGNAGRRVGYVSPSQFSREYGRFFGTAPMKDIHRLREEHPSGAEAPA